MRTEPKPTSTLQGIELSLPSDESLLDLAHGLSSLIPISLGASEEFADMIANAVLEATRNAMSHGNGFDPHIPVTINFRNNDGNIVVRIEDQGAGFNPESVDDPTAVANLLKSCGRGIFLMRTFMDSVDIQSQPGSTVVTLTKAIEPIDPVE